MVILGSAKAPNGGTITVYREDGDYKVYNSSADTMDWDVWIMPDFISAFRVVIDFCELRRVVDFTDFAEICERHGGK